MPKNKVLSAVIIGLCLLGILLVRAFEQQWFYDPFTAFFKSEYMGRPLPEYDSFRLLGAYGLRFAVNSTLSLLILYALFRDNRLIRFFGLLYVVCFAVFSIGFFAVVSMDEPPPMLVFYLRRFLIHPVLLLVFAAAVFYQRRLAKK